LRTARGQQGARGGPRRRQRLRPLGGRPGGGVARATRLRLSDRHRPRTARAHRHPLRPEPLQPGRAVVEAALAAASAGPVAMGSVGAGTGATIGKALGPANGMKGGFGFASLTVPGGPTVAAAVAVNAFGDVRRLDGTLLAGCLTAPDSRELAS